MKRFLQSIFLSCFLVLSATAFGQGFIEQVQFGDAHQFQQLQPKNIGQSASVISAESPNLSSIVSNGEIIQLSNSFFNQMRNQNSDRVVMTLNLADQNLEMMLIKSPVFTANTNVFAATDRQTNLANSVGQFYWGVIKNHPGSFVSLSIFEDEVMAFINMDQEDYSLGKLTDSGEHIFYKNSDLLVASNTECAMEEEIHQIGDVQHRSSGNDRDASNCVNMYIEVNHDIYQDKGGVTEASNYALGILNQTAILYANESINFSVTEMVVWDVPSPYTGPGSGDYLDQFGAEMGNSFNGDLAHLMGYGGGGGVAYLDVLCSSYYRWGYSGVGSSYSNVPTYSWSVMVLTHEIGHNLGSPHTHSCSWNGEGNDAIDGCGYAAGYTNECNGPIPSAGTIMSYCHLISGVGIDLSLGFGVQPGDLIRDRVYNRPCLGACVSIDDCQVPYNVSTENITESSVDLVWFQAGAALSWDIEYGPTGFTPTGTPDITGATSPQLITGLTPATSYTFFVRANCDGGEQSPWSDGVIGTTLCSSAVGIPFTETFEDASGTRGCWSQDGAGGQGFWSFQSGSSGGNIDAAYEGSLNARFVSQGPSGAGTPVTKLISPPLDLSGYDFVEMAFHYGQEQWYNDQNELKVYYRSGPLASWVELEHFTNEVSTWTLHVVRLPNTSSGYQVAFEGINNWGYANVLDEVIVREVPFSNISATACESYTLNGETYIDGGFYTQTIPSYAGGDSLIFLDLTINYNTASSQTISTCDEYDLNGTIYSDSGTFTQVIPNAAGCDSTITLNLTILGQTDDCGDCIIDGPSDPNWNQSCADCNGVANGSAFTDNCGTCVGGDTGLEACVQDCNGEYGGTAYLDNCGTCVGGSTGQEPCVADCNGVFGGSAFTDNCGTCVGGDTGLEACVQDCNFEYGGTAYLDNCGTCVGGSTGQEPCVADCNGVFGGSAFTDNCGTCVGGDTGLEACVQDCNGEYGGTAYLDNCGTCVGGNTGQEPCAADCNGVFGGSAFTDNCGTCVGGDTGLEACVQDCNGEYGGTAYLDNCGTCVGGNTGQEPCVADCNGVFGGTAYLDDCATCVGGDTGLEPCCGLILTGSTTPADIGFSNGSATVTVTGGQEPYTYEWNDPFMQTTATATGLFPGAYTCIVTDGNDCVEEITLTISVDQAIPLTALTGGHCNSIDRELHEFISAIVVSGANAYRFEFTEQGGSVLPEITRYGSQHIRLQWVSGIALGETYNVRVKVRVDGVWGEYGDVCTVSTLSDIPLTELLPSYHPSNAQGNAYELCDFAIAYSVSGATNYRWRFDPDNDANNGNEVVYTRGSSNPGVRLSWVNSLSPETGYYVSVAINIGGTWGNYGPVHQINLGGVPSPVLRANYCNQNYSGNELLLSTSVCDADFYQFRFERVDNGALRTFTSGNYVVFMSWANPNLAPGDYLVRVRASQNGVMGNFGSACPITIGNPPAMQDGGVASQRSLTKTTGHEVTLFPNPSDGSEVRLEVSNLRAGNSKVAVIVTDMYGRQLAAEHFAYSGSHLSQLIRFESTLPKGVYLIQVVIDGDLIESQRLVVN